MSSKLAGNMTIDEAAPKSSAAAAKAGIVMQVNKYVPHYQRIPQKFDKKDFKIFEYGPETENEADRY